MTFIDTQISEMVCYLQLFACRCCICLSIRNGGDVDILALLPLYTNNGMFCIVFAIKEVVHIMIADKYVITTTDLRHVFPLNDGWSSALQAAKSYYVDIDKSMHDGKSSMTYEDALVRLSHDIAYIVALLNEYGNSVNAPVPLRDVFGFYAPRVYITLASLPASHPWHLCATLDEIVDATIDYYLSREIVDKSHGVWFGSGGKSGQMFWANEHDALVELWIDVCELLKVKGRDRLIVARRISDNNHNQRVFRFVIIVRHGVARLGMGSVSYLDAVSSVASAIVKRSYLPDYAIEPDAFSKALRMSSGAVSSYKSFSLSDDQYDAVVNTIKHHVSFVFGYAGTGKTTSLRVFVNYCRVIGKTISAMALSGKAVHNFVVQTGIEPSHARTIAAYLNSGAHIHTDVLIVEEVSMVTELDLFRILKLVDETTQIVFIGDRAQLPAIDAPGVLSTLFSFSDHTDVLPISTLTQAHRQDGESKLFSALTSFRSGQSPDLSRSVTYPIAVGDDSFVYYNGPNIRDFIVDRYVELAGSLARGEITVLTSTKRDAQDINLALQEKLTARGLCVDSRGKFGKFSLYVNDQVLLTKNAYQVITTRGDKMNIFNGFLGEVVKIIPKSVSFPHDRVVVRFNDVYVNSNDREVMFYSDAQKLSSSMKSAFTRDVPDVKSLELGYAMTVHKAQGSTVDTVFYWLKKSFTPAGDLMSTRESVYTAASRAHSQLFFLTEDLKGSVSELEQQVTGLISSSAYSKITSYLGTALSDCAALLPEPEPALLPEPEPEPRKKNGYDRFGLDESARHLIHGDGDPLVIGDRQLTFVSDLCDGSIDDAHLSGLRGLYVLVGLESAQLKIGRTHDFESRKKMYNTFMRSSDNGGPEFSANEAVAIRGWYEVTTDCEWNLRALEQVFKTTALCSLSLNGKRYGKQADGTYPIVNTCLRTSRSREWVRGDLSVIQTVLEDTHRVYKLDVVQRLMDGSILLSPKQAQFFVNNMLELKSVDDVVSFVQSTRWCKKLLLPVVR